MLLTWLPGMTMCMSIVGNSSGDSQFLRGLNGKQDFNFETYLGAAQILLKAALSSRCEKDRDISDRRKDTAENLNTSRCPSMPIDCEELLVECGSSVSGVYRIYPRSRVSTWGDGGFDVYCDMQTDGGGWTVFQLRGDFGAKPDFFYKDWQEYKQGFGDLKHDFWLGNNKLFALTNQRSATLRIDLQDFEGESRYALYDSFYVEDESHGYRLHLGDFHGNIGDSLSGHNLCKFTTKDRSNDNNRNYNCARLYKGGWWYNNCHTANLNGLYLRGVHGTYADGVNWYGWKGFFYSLKRTEMKIRSSSFVANRADAKQVETEYTIIQEVVV